MLYHLFIGKGILPEWVFTKTILRHSFMIINQKYQSHSFWEDTICIPQKNQVGCFLIFPGQSFYSTKYAY